MSSNQPTEPAALPARFELAPGLSISRIVTGLWQIADMERSGAPLDAELASTAMLDYARAGFDSFDMADHYGSAELISGRFLKRVAAGEAPAPTDPPCSRSGARHRARCRPRSCAPVSRGAGSDCGVDAIDLLQFHWWSFDHPSYLDALNELAALKDEGLIRHIGLTNFDTAHLRVAVEHGIPIAANQVCFSLLDRRAAAEMSSFCLDHGVRLLAYGTLGGGLIARRWLGRARAQRRGDRRLEQDEI